jgi:enoyl-CoA hydratase
VEFENLLLEIRPPLAVITVNRPKVLNALNAATIEELFIALEQVVADPAVRVALLTGSGSRAFVAGADIAQVAGLDESAGRAYAERGQAVFRRLETFGKPVIAAINGFALGGGCELAMACTLRLASDTARLGMPEAKLGLIPGFGGTQRLPRLVGRGAALKLLMTGTMIDAAEALRIGLVDEVVTAEELMPRAEAIALQIAQNAPIALSRAIIAVDKGLDLSLDEGMAEEARHFGHCCGTRDKAEGTAAFLAKRPPVWSGG